MTRLLPGCLLLAGCGGVAPAPPPPGAAQAQISFLAGDVAAPLTLADGTLHLASLALVGDVERGASLADVDVPLVGAPPSGGAVQLADLAAGVYGRLQLQLDRLTAHGHWRNRQLSVCVRLDGATVDLRAPADDVAGGQTLALAVAIDDAAWWQALDLDAVPGDDDDEIFIDSTHNDQLAGQLRAALPPTFSLVAATP